MAAHIFVHEIEFPSPVGTMTIGAPNSHDLIIDPGNVTEEAFPYGRNGGLFAPRHGTTVYANIDGRFTNTLIGQATDGAKLTCRVGPPDGDYPADFTIDYVAYVDGTPKLTKETCTLKLRGRDALFSQRVSQLGFDYALSDTAGTRLRPLVYGTPGFPPLVLYIPFDVADGNVWYIQKNPPTDIDFVYDGGRQLINQGEASSLSDLFLTAPNPSSYRWYYDDGTGGAENEGLWIRLGSKVRADLRFYADSPTITISDLAIMAGMADAATMVADSVDLSVGSRVIEQQTYREVLDDVARAHASVIGISRDDKLFQRYLRTSINDEDYDTDVVLIDAANSWDWEVGTPDSMDGRIWEIKVNAGRTQQGQLAGIPNLDAAAAEMLNRKDWLTSFTASAASVKADEPNAKPLVIDIEANHFAGDDEAMTAYAADLLALFGGTQVWYWGTAQYTEETAALQLMDRVALDGGTEQQLAMTGRVGRIVSIERRLKADEIRFGVWVHYSTVDAEDVVLTTLDDASTATPGASLSRGTGANVRPVQSMTVACSDATTPIEVGLLRTIPNWPEDVLLCGIEGGLTTAQASGSTFTVDVEIDGVSAFSTLLTIPNTDTQSAPGTMDDLALFEIPKGAKVEIYATQVGDGTAVELVLNFLVLP